MLKCSICLITAWFLTFAVSLDSLSASPISVGNGSYATLFPGVDSAGRNGYPGGNPQVSEAALGRPVPTNDWWSAVLKKDHADNLFNYPLSMRTLPTGLDIGRIIPADGANGSAQPLSDISPVIVGVDSLAATRATAANYSDWTVTLSWQDSPNSFKATMGMGMPFVYFQKGSEDTATVTVNVGRVTILNEVLLIEESQSGANFAVYGPSGATWVQAGNTYSSTLSGKNYWSLALLPSGNAPALAEAFQAFAYVEPTNTQLEWHYDETTAVLRTEFTTTAIQHEGTENTVLQGLLPHHWAYLSDDSPDPSEGSLSTIRGELKLLASNTFATERTFHGILPTLPALTSGSPQFNPAELNNKISLMENESLSTWTDSYNEGQVMNRLIQTARIAHETGNSSARDNLLATIKNRLEDWLTVESGEVAFLFYYDATWTTLIGYPAGHGQDTNINDHHFHWGYFIHAAAFLEQFEPGWAENWGDMVNLLVRDAASADRSDSLFPFLRSFNPFAGHAWANGFATFPFGNDQESSSESMQFNSALIHWGAVTGNKSIRDLGIYLYTTEQTAIEEYWFDVNDRTFQPNYGTALASRIWGNGYDNQTFWTGDIAAAYGIELYPIHGGSLYLVHNREYAHALWAEMATRTGILAQAVNPNLWHDVYWQFLALMDPDAAIDLYNTNPGRALKFGISDAHTYYWLHTLKTLGKVDTSVTANDPLAVVFEKDDRKIYVAHNYTNSVKSIAFSDGTNLIALPQKLSTSLDIPFSGTISTPFPFAPTGNSVTLDVSITGDSTSLTAFEVYDGANHVGTLYEEPYTFFTEPLSAGRHEFHARLYAGDSFTLTGFTSVIVGEQFPFNGEAHSLPGTIQAGHYDIFEGGTGQNVTHWDASIENHGDYRLNEAVDVTDSSSEGAVVGWIANGEWLEFTVDVQTAGLYDLTFRYACGNTSGGGPFFIESNGQQVSSKKTVSYTGDWAAFQTASLNGIALDAGMQVLRIVFEGGELNLGELNFSLVAPLAIPRPVANAGTDETVVAPASSAMLDGSASINPSDTPLIWLWEQTAGPVAATLSNASSPTTEVQGLNEDGLYRFRLTVSDGQNSHFDSVDIQRGATAQRPPNVRITQPMDASLSIIEQPVTISISASDSDGHIQRLDLFNGETFIASLDTPPYTYDWFPPEGAHSITVVATDNDSLSTSSAPIDLVVNRPQPCQQASASGDFEYRFNNDPDNPTITFVPARTGVGANIVLFYYGTGGGPLPGYVIEPNKPFPLIAESGQTINFYFTYSVPEGGERNTIAENSAYTIGSCGDSAAFDMPSALEEWTLSNFSSASLDNPELEDSLWGALADPDSDGISNIMEFVTGSNPNSVSPSPLALFHYPDGSAISIRFTRLAGLDNQMLSIQQSSDFHTWIPSTLSTSVVSQKDGLQIVDIQLPYNEWPNTLFRLIWTP